MENLPITYSERKPFESLKTWIQSLWTFDASALKESQFSHFVPPDGCVSLLANMNAKVTERQLTLLAPRWIPTQVAITPGDVYHGVRFWPFAGRAILGDGVADMVGNVGPLQFLLPQLAERIKNCQQAEQDRSWHDALQAALVPILSESSAIDELSRRATELIVFSRGQVPIERLAIQLDIGLRQLQRRFVASTGLNLKQFARIRRFREAIRELLEANPRTWCQIALEAGYADQSHLTREFVQLVGLSPSQLQSQYDFIFHDSVDP